MVGNGVGFFTAAGSSNHVHQCRIEGNELGMYVQKESFVTVTDTQILASSVCGMRLMSSGAVSTGNTFADNFVGNIALDGMILMHMNCIFTGSEDCDMFVRGCSVVQLIGNAFDGAMTDSCQLVNSENLIFAE